MIVPSESVSIKDWCNSLLIDYNSRDAIPIIEDESKWKEWGNMLSSQPTFASRGSPTTENFSNWWEWGIIVYETMAK